MLIICETTLNPNLMDGAETTDVPFCGGLLAVRYVTAHQKMTISGAAASAPTSVGVHFYCPKIDEEEAVKTSVIHYAQYADMYCRSLYNVPYTKDNFINALCLLLNSFGITAKLYDINSGCLC